MTSSPARGLPGSNALDKKRDDRSREVQAWDPESAVLHVREVDVHGVVGRGSFGWMGIQDAFEETICTVCRPGVKR